MDARFEALTLGLMELEREAQSIAEISGRPEEIRPIIEAIRTAQSLADMAWESTMGVDWSTEVGDQ